MSKYLVVNKSKFFVTLLTVFLSFYLIGGCGGGNGNNMGNGTGDVGNGPGPGTQTRVVTGIVNTAAAKNISPNMHKAKVAASYIIDFIAPSGALAVGEAGTFLVTAAARDGSMHEVDTHPVTGEFMMELPVDHCYTMSFMAHNGEGMMDEFLGFMVFECGLEHIGELDDQFCLTDGGGVVDLGMIAVHSDNRFAMPIHNPLEEMDFNSNGVMDFHDPDYVCGNVEDGDHDGYYDDDMNHDGFHDGDMNHDGFHDGDMDHDGFHDDGDMHRDDFNGDNHMGGEMGGGMI